MNTPADEIPGHLLLDQYRERPPLDCAASPRARRSRPRRHAARGAALGRLFSASLLGIVAIAAPVLAQTPWPPAPPVQPAPETDPGELPSSITATSADGGAWNVTFSYKPAPTFTRINLAGDFSAWNANDNALADPDGDGVFSITLPLESGEYRYKFVLAGDRWVHDPGNPLGEPDGHNGTNSILRLGRLYSMKTSTATVGDNIVDAAGLEHRQNLPLFFQPLAPERALVRYRTFSHDVRTASVAVKGGETVRMHLLHEGPVFTLWEALVAVPASPNRKTAAYRVDYTFVIEDGTQRVSDPNTYSASFTDATIFHTPEWAKNAIWYQIMVDRFRNGDPSNDPENCRPWKSEWFSASPWEEKSGETFYKNFVYHRLYGGDLAGVEQKLPYLKELGINAIYFNPVFKAPTHHKYDATNYLHIDDHFGKKGDYEAIAATEDLLDPKTWKWTESDKMFLALVKKCHDMGIRVIIDGVFNHVGVTHPAFQDVKKNREKSRFADWFDVLVWDPFKYNGWAGVDSLPAFKKSPEGLASTSAKEHIFNATRRWMDPNGDGDPNDGIDGWRLDVPNEIPMPFWAEWRQVVKKANPNAYITGEIWDRAEQWLDGRHFDAVMNYEFARPVIQWTMHKKTKITPTELDRKMRDLRLAYPHAATLVLQNLVDSHDTDRVVSMALNPDRHYDHENRVQDNGPKYSNDKPNEECYRRSRLVALIQMTYVGAPMIYYGDEVGMWGADDPTCRKPMLWEDLEPYDKPEENFVMKDHLAYYRKAIALRNEHPALRTGDMETLRTDDGQDVWAFLRYNQDEELVVVLNASGKEQSLSVPIPPGSPREWTTIFGGEGKAEFSDGHVHVTVPPIAGVVLHAKVK
ncbi:Neopullulanase 2 [Phycisphaerae bacterium RAS1]|nr:Neopullulanase 2 [Phycisphaerae bacterium RAS1]